MNDRTTHYVKKNFLKFQKEFLKILCSNFDNWNLMNYEEGSYFKKVEGSEYVTLSKEDESAYAENWYRYQLPNSDVHEVFGREKNMRLGQLIKEYFLRNINEFPMVRILSNSKGETIYKIGKFCINTNFTIYEIPLDKKLGRSVMLSDPQIRFDVLETLGIL